MPVLDSTSFAGNGTLPTALSCDVCIIGTGPAGSTLARELSDSRIRVTVLESGGVERQELADSLNDIESVGWPRVMDQWLVRNRILGGSSHTWTGRCAPFDDIDLERRPWVPYSGWPFGMDELTDYLDRSSFYLGLGAGSSFSDDRFWRLAGHRQPASSPDPAKLLHFFWQYSRDLANPYDYMRFGRHLASKVGSNVTLVTNATVVKVNAVASADAVASVEFASLDGRRWTLPATTVVMCCGGVENARLLLASDNVVPSGLGNERDVVGRFLMDHPRGTLARFRLDQSEGLLKRFGFFKSGAGTKNLFQHGLRLSPAVQRDEHLLNCAAWIHESIVEDDPWHALKRFLRGKADLRKDTMMILANAGLFARGLREYFILRSGLPRKIDGVSLDGMCEQRPNPDSRITLSDRSDWLGVRLSRIDWRIHEEDVRTMRRMAELAVEQFPRLGFDPPTLEPWVRDGATFPTAFQDIAHPTGTTRMARDPALGVVDETCRVHGVEGLFIAGSSIFPTAGHCNPTQMIVTLALRLADTLKSRFAAAAGSAMLVRRGSPTAGATPMAAGDAAHRVLVTGAAGHIGRHVVAELLARGYRVRALTSKPVAESMQRPCDLEWFQFDFRQSLVFDPLLEGCSAVLHLGAELGDMDRMQRSNVDATRALAQASERAGIRVFCYTSSAAVYGSSRHRRITEDNPVLTSDYDVGSEYWAIDTLRCYGRTKLQGEQVIRAEADHVEFVVLRPTVVVDVPDLIDLGNWSRLRKNLAGNRHAHHIYVRDVADAILWFMERGLRREVPAPGVSVFNLAEDDFADNTYAHLFAMAHAVSGDPRFRIMPVPWQIDWLRAALQFRHLAWRHPFGRMVFLTEKLRSTGYSPRFGMAYALREMQAELRQRAGDAARN